MKNEASKKSNSQICLLSPFPYWLHMLGQKSSHLSTPVGYYQYFPNHSSKLDNREFPFGVQNINQRSHIVVKQLSNSLVGTMRQLPYQHICLPSNHKIHVHFNIRDLAVGVKSYQIMVLTACQQATTTLMVLLSNYYSTFCAIMVLIVLLCTIQGKYFSEKPQTEGARLGK